MENLAIAGVPCIPRDNYFLGIILTWAAAADDVYGRKLGTIQLRDIPDMNHVWEPQFCYLDGKGFNFTCPYRRDAIANGAQWEASDPIEKASHRQHGLQPHGAEGMPFRKRPLSFCNFLCADVDYRDFMLLCQTDFRLHTG